MLARFNGASVTVPFLPIRAAAATVSTPMPEWIVTVTRVAIPSLAISCRGLTVKDYDVGSAWSQHLPWPFVLRLRIPVLNATREERR